MTPALSEQAPRTAAASRGALTMALIRDEAGFFALEPFWDALVDQMTTRSPFLRWDWVSLWWRTCRRDDSRLVIAVLKDEEGLPHAIAPLMLARENDRARHHLTALTFLAGFGPAHGERLDFIVPAGSEDALTPRLCRVFKLLRNECDVIRLNHLPEESPNTPHILAAMEESFLHAGVLNRYACHFIRLPDTSDGYDKRHTGAWRSKLRRRQKAIAAQHAGEESVAGERVSYEDAMQALHELHAMQWPVEASSFIKPASWRFHQFLAEKWLPQGRAILPLLIADGRVIAAMHGFVERDEFFQFQMGWDPAFARLSPGKLVMRWCIECSIRRGLRAHDMLPSEYEYKRQWCESLRWLLDVEAFSPASWRAAAFHTLRTARRLMPRRPETETGPTNDLQEEPTA